MGSDLDWDDIEVILYKGSYSIDSRWELRLPDCVVALSFTALRGGDVEIRAHLWSGDQKFDIRNGYMCGGDLELAKRRAQRKLTRYRERVMLIFQKHIDAASQK